MFLTSSQSFFQFISNVAVLLLPRRRFSSRLCVCDCVCRYVCSVFKNNEWFFGGQRTGRSDFVGDPDHNPDLKFPNPDHDSDPGIL